jgi:hypothetical protein
LSHSHASLRSWIVACFSKMGLEIELESDLHVGLKNGIVLCYMMQNFAPQSIPRIHESASQMFNYRQNIVFFLAACEMVGVPRHKLFRVSDLWENASMVNVVDCLTALAHTCAVKWPDRVAPFELPEANDSLLQSIGNAERIELLKQIRLSSVGAMQLTRRMTAGYRLSLRNVASEVTSWIEASVAKDSAKSQLLKAGVTRAQAVFRGMRDRQIFCNRLRDSAYRERVAFEILSTEQTYVDSLAICVDVYLRPLEAAANSGNRLLLSEDKIQILFRGLETILHSNRQLLASLSRRLERWHPNTCVGDVFGLIESFIPHYTEYIQNYTEAVVTLKREQRKKHFKEFLSQKKMDPRCKGRELDQFLIMPVQR